MEPIDASFRRSAFFASRKLPIAIFLVIHERVKSELDRRLSEMIRSHEELKARFKKVDADLASQRERFKKELTRLQVKAPEAIRRPERPGSGKGGRISKPPCTRDGLKLHQKSRRLKKKKAAAKITAPKKIDEKKGYHEITGSLPVSFSTVPVTSPKFGRA